MSRLHICNTFFEKELETTSQYPLLHWIRSNPIVAQLQFLPLLYAAPEDRILVSDLPTHPDPRLCLIDRTPPAGCTIEHWGPSQAIASWAKQHQLPYAMPDWRLVQKINSKIFSFTHSPKLPGAELLATSKDIQSWIAKTSGPKVLKTPFGTAGKGHIHKPNVKQLYIGPLIGEPWVERVCDFSTQWENGELIGITLFENTPNGTYKRTYAGMVEDWAIEEHLAIAKPLIKQIAKIGYSGHIGLDAFIYFWKGKKKLHPIVEINARKTMSWIYLAQSKQNLHYIPSKTGALPSSLMICGKTVHFPRNIVLS